MLNYHGLSVGVKAKDKGNLLFQLGLKNITGCKNDWFWNALNIDWLSTPWETCPILSNHVQSCPYSQTSLKTLAVQPKQQFTINKKGRGTCMNERESNVCWYAVDRSIASNSGTVPFPLARRYATDGTNLLCARHDLQHRFSCCWNSINIPIPQPWPNRKPQGLCNEM